METPTRAAHPPSRRSAVFTALFALAGIVTLLSGCASTPPPREHQRPLQPPLVGRTDFFDGAVVADASVEGVHLNRPGAQSGEDRGSPRGDRPGGGFGEHRGTLQSAGEGGGPGAGARRFAGMPGQTLRIALANHGAQPVEFAITELNSLIGNFAPRPARLTLAPGESASLDPVSGDPGGILNWIDVTLTLRRSGGAETRVLHLTPAAPAP